MKARLPVEERHLEDPHEDHAHEDDEDPSDALEQVLLVVQVVAELAGRGAEGHEHEAEPENEAEGNRDRRYLLGGSPAWRTPRGR